MATSNLSALHFHDPDKARKYLESQVWPNGPVCPHCGGVERNSKLEGKSHRAGLYFCGDCREQFTVTVGTVFERSKIPLSKWLMAAYLLCSSKKGMSSHQLHRTLGITYKSAWFMTHRIRTAMAGNSNGLLGSGGGHVEVDETYWGKTAEGKARHRKISMHDKMKVVSLVQRGGEARSFHVHKVDHKTLHDLIAKNVSPDTHLFTDQNRLYWGAKGKTVKTHERVNHSKGEYARGHVTINTVEGYFSILKRGLIGTYHHVGEQHLIRYVKEFDFRYNNRKALGISDAARTDAVLKGIVGKRLTYRRTASQQATQG